MTREEEKDQLKRDWKKLSGKELSMAMKSYFKKHVKPIQRFKDGLL